MNDKDFLGNRYSTGSLEIYVRRFIFVFTITTGSKNYFMNESLDLSFYIFLRIGSKA